MSLPPDVAELAPSLALALAVRCRDGLAVRQIAARIANYGPESGSRARDVRAMLDEGGRAWLRNELAGDW
jgi:hypothetical protein